MLPNIHFRIGPFLISIASYATTSSALEPKSILIVSAFQGPLYPILATYHLTLSGTVPDTQSATDFETLDQAKASSSSSL